MTKQDLEKLLEAVNNIENVVYFCKQVSEKTNRPVKTIQSIITNFKRTWKIKKVENYDMLVEYLYVNNK